MLLQTLFSWTNKTGPVVRNKNFQLDNKIWAAFIRPNLLNWSLCFRIKKLSQFFLFSTLSLLLVSLFISLHLFCIPNKNVSPSVYRCFIALSLVFFFFHPLVISIVTVDSFFVMEMGKNE